jgi:hypothetical protein
MTIALIASLRKSGFRLFPAIIAVLMPIGSAPAASPSSGTATVASERPAFRPFRTDAAAVRRAHLESTIAAMRTRLARAPADIREAWERYLELDALVGSFGASIDEQLARLEALRLRLSVDVEGLEDEEPVALRAAANAYAATLALSRVDPEAAFQRDLDVLADDLPIYARRPTQAVADRIGAAIGRLEAAEQAPELITAIRDYWSRPNVVVFVRTDFINGYLARTIEDARYQTANILGTQSGGVAQTTAKLELATLDNEEQAEFQVRIAGTSETRQSIGRNGPATIFGGSVSRFEVAKNIRFDSERVLAVDPTSVRCSTNISVRNIDVQTRVLPAVTKSAATRIAWNKSREQESAAEQEVSRLVGRRIESKLDEQLAGPVEAARRYYQSFMVDRPTRFDEAPQVSSRSTTGGAFFQMRQARAFQLGAPSAPPEFDPATQFGVAFHQSAFNNASSRSIFGGGLQTDEQIEHYVQLMGGEVPPDLRVFSNSIPWSVNVDIERPNTLIFDEGKIDLTIHTKCWTLGDRRFERAVDLKVVYEPGLSTIGMLFNRVGSTRIEAADGKPWTAEELSTLVPHIERKFAAAFPESGHFNALILPKGEAFGPLGTTEPKQIYCDHGWALVGYQKTAAAEIAEGQVVTAGGSALPAAADRR